MAHEAAICASPPDKTVALSRSPVLQRALGIIHDNYADPRLSLTGISEQLRISERHLRRIFIAYTGQTFREHVRSLRIQRATGLLAGSALGVKAVAAAVGYSDASHFVRYFRKATGRTPAQFRSRSA